MSSGNFMKRFFAFAASLAALVVSIAAQASTITYYHNDLLGSPVVATNSSGQVIWRESYRPYGERLVNDAAGAPNDLWYAGRRADATTGLVYMGARYYDPVTGRFVSKDPVGFDEKNIQSFNRYAYANDNPYRFIDPTGREGADTLWMADDSVFVVTGRDFAALAAYAQGEASGDQNLIDASVQAMREQNKGSRNTVTFLLSLGRAPAEGMTDSEGGLTAAQIASLARFEKKLPGDPMPTKVFDLPGGGKAFQADVPGDVPGSYAQYEKQLDSSGRTFQYTKTTFDPSGNIVHIKDKINNQTILP